jgi:hypothetical protein
LGKSLKVWGEVAQIIAAAPTPSNKLAYLVRRSYMTAARLAVKRRARILKVFNHVVIFLEEETR